MDDAFRSWLEDALGSYDKVVFLYQLSDEMCAGLRAVLGKEENNFLLLTDREVSDFPCSWKKLCEKECEWLLDLYFSYSFADNFIFLAYQKKFPWPSAASFMETGVFERQEILEALLK